MAGWLFFLTLPLIVCDLSKNKDYPISTKQLSHFFVFKNHSFAQIVIIRYLLHTPTVTASTFAVYGYV